MVEQGYELPALVDYIAFAQDPDLKKLIGNGKDISFFKEIARVNNISGYWNLNIVIDSSNSPLIFTDTLVYANNIKKTNSWGMSQVRTLAITNNAIYNIHSKKIKRSIMIKDITAITKTVPPSKN